MTLSDLERRGPYLFGESRSVRSIATRFHAIDVVKIRQVIDEVDRGVFLGSAVPNPKGHGPSLSQILRDAYMYVHPFNIQRLNSAA